VRQLHLLPWRDADKNTAPPITNVFDCPTQITDLRAYVDKVRPRGGKTTLWSAVGIAFTGSINDVLSGQDSDISWCYEEIKGGAYPYEVQNLEEDLEVGVPAYASNHTNQFNLLRVPRGAPT